MENPFLIPNRNVKINFTDRANQVKDYEFYVTKEEGNRLITWFGNCYQSVDLLIKVQPVEVRP